MDRYRVTRRIAGIDLSRDICRRHIRLDSILAALSQTTLSLVRDRKDAKESNEKGDLFLSRLLVLIWGILLAAFAVELDGLRGKVNVVVLAFGMISYTTGPMLGMFLAALLTPKASARGLSLGFALSFALVAYLRPDFYQILLNFDLLDPEQVAEWSGLRVKGEKLMITINTVWAWPVTVFLTRGADSSSPPQKNEDGCPLPNTGKARVRTGP